jgi:hypothetical protein
MSSRADIVLDNDCFPSGEVGFELVNKNVDLKAKNGVFEEKNAPGRTRTCGLQFRKLSLYPPELRVQTIIRIISNLNKRKKRGNEFRQILTHST